MTPDVRNGLRSELLGDEGKKLRVYDDATGKAIGPGTLVKGQPSIGIGRNLSARGITDAESEMMLADDMECCEKELIPILPWLAQVSTKRQIAVYSLYFNLYLGNPKGFLAKWPAFLGQMQSGQFEIAAANLRTSQPWAHEVGPRANRLADMVLYG